MESHQLTEDHLQQLYQFTRAHYVYHYDVQTELVDHLANGIEAQWAKYPQRSFQEALELEFKKFGVFGFQDVLAEKEKAMGKKYRKILWRFMIDWFRLPKIIVTASLLILFFYLLRFSPFYEHAKYLTVVVLGLTMVVFTVRVMQLKKHMKRQSKKWLLQELIFNQSVTLQMVMLPFYLTNYGQNDFFLSNLYGQLLLALMLTLTLLVVTISAFVLPKRAEFLLKETYPEYQMG